MVNVPWKKGKSDPEEEQIDLAMPIYRSVTDSGELLLTASSACVQLHVSPDGDKVMFIFHNHLRHEDEEEAIIEITISAWQAMVFSALLSAAAVEGAIRPVEVTDLVRDNDEFRSIIERDQ